MHDVIDTARPAAESAELRLADILSPVSPEEFLAEYWGRRSLYIPGPYKSFSKLLDRKSFIRFAAKADALEAWIADKERTQNAGITTIVPRQIEALYAGGFTICAKGLEKGSPVLAALTQQAKAALHYTGTVDFRGYMSGHGSGATTHFDARHATTLQIEGEKVWRFASAPSVPFPPRNAVLRGEVPEYIKTEPIPRVRELGLDPELPPPSPELEFREVTLRPGDVLYLPPGTWHSAQAVGHSLAVNMAFNYASTGTALELMADLIYALLYADPKWRMPAPAFMQDAPDGDMPECVRSFLGERLESLRQALAGFEPTDPRLEAIWRRRMKGK